MLEICIFSNVKSDDQINYYNTVLLCMKKETLEFISVILVISNHVFQSKYYIIT